MPFVSTRRRAPASNPRRRSKGFTRKSARMASLKRWGKKYVPKGRRAGVHRPRLRWSPRKGWMSMPRGMVKKGTRINPRRRRRSYRRRRNPVAMFENPIRRRRRTRRNTVARYNPRRRRSYARRNPAKGIMKSLTSRKVLTTGITIGGGIVAGSLAMPLLYRYLPTSVTKYDKYLGVAHVAIGALMFSFMKNKMLKELGLVIAGTGIYDLVASNAPDLGLPKLPRTSPFIDQITGSKSKAALPEPSGASYPIARQPVSAAARYGAPFAASYQQPFGASYQAPGMPIEGFGSDSPYGGVEGWE